MKDFQLEYLYTWIDLSVDLTHTNYDPNSSINYFIQYCISKHVVIMCDKYKNKNSFKYLIEY